MAKVIWQKGQKAAINRRGNALFKDYIVTVQETYTDVDANAKPVKDVKCEYKGKMYFVTPTDLDIIVWEPGDKATVTTGGNALSRGVIVEVKVLYTKPQYDKKEHLKCEYKGKTLLVKPTDLD